MAKKKKIIIAPDSFKGVLSASEAADAISTGVITALKKKNSLSEFEIISIPIADGGEGMADIIGNAIKAKKYSSPAFDPLLNPIEGHFRLKNDIAFIDLADSAGLSLIQESLRNPMRASTFGFGIVIKNAVSRGARKLILGLGGSATNDAGISALQPLGLRIRDKKGILYNRPITGKDLINIGEIEVQTLEKEIENISFQIACDVRNPFTGKQGAAEIFAPQKGADRDDVIILEKGMENIERILKHQTGINLSAIPGAGAAGGCGGGFAALLHAEIREGIEVVLEYTEFDKSLEGASLVITGEGSADRQTLMGKAPYGVLRHASSRNIPVALYAGRIADRNQLIEGGFLRAECINPPRLPEEEALQPDVARRNLSAKVEKDILSNIITNFAL